MLAYSILYVVYCHTTLSITLFSRVSGGGLPVAPFLSNQAQQCHRDTERTDRSFQPSTLLRLIAAAATSIYRCHLATVHFLAPPRMYPGQHHRYDMIAPQFCGFQKSIYPLRTSRATGPRTHCPLMALKIFTFTLHCRLDSNRTSSNPNDNRSLN